MATKKATPKAPVNTPAKQNKAAQAASHARPVMDLLNRENYFIIAGGALILMIGYLLMAGGEQKPTEWKVNEIYSYQRIIVAPIIVIIGYIAIGFGLMVRTKKEESKP